MLEIKRFSTQYIDREDRFRVSADIGAGKTLVIWLTQRMLIRLLPHLLKPLESQTPPETAQDKAQSGAVQSFKQQAARASVKKAPPVKADPDSQVWLAQAINVTVDKKVLALGMKGNNDKQQAKIVFVDGTLRQWLNMLYSQWKKAGWPTDSWPRWIQDSHSESSTVSADNAVH